MDKTRIIGQKCLVNELFLSLYAIKKCAKALSNPIIFSKVIVFTDDRRRQIPRRKTHFFSLPGLKTWRFDENWESDFLHKTNTFSYDENVKIKWIYFLYQKIKVTTGSVSLQLCYK